MNIGNKVYYIINNKRDIIEQAMCNRYSHIPKLGICRGAQFLTVLAGGKLIQHVNGHDNTHKIQTSFNMPEGHFKSYIMSSSHHQMMYPYNMNENNFELIAWSEYYKSSTYLNGDDLEINLPFDFLEPEIVYYKYINALCIQGHPEYNNIPKETFEYIKNLINTYLT